MLAEGCAVSSSELITSTGEAEVVSVRSVRRVPSTTMDSATSDEAAGASAGAGASCANAAADETSATAKAVTEVVILIIRSPSCQLRLKASFPVALWFCPVVRG